VTTRALVLGGGGITGIAWETGLLAGLAAEGVDLTGADRVIGTSAGSIVGAQVTSDIGLEELYRRQLLPPDQLGDGSAPLARMTPRVWFSYAASMIQSLGDVDRFCRVLGARAVEAADRGAVPTVAERYEQVAKRIGGLTWPERDLRVTAVDVETGALVVFGPNGDHPDVPLEDAVNASCAVPCVYPPIPIGGRSYVDGGARSGSNADLAAGCDVVVTVSPLDRNIGTQRSAAVQLRELGVPHVVITPDAAARAAIGRNILDPAARPPSARAGHAQAAAHADALRDLWR
jgi:NTE family protein